MVKVIMIRHAGKLFLSTLFALLLVVPHQTQAAAQGTGSYMILPDGGNMLIYGTAAGYFILDRNKILNADISKNIEKLSSGLRIVNPSDDPSGFAVAEKMRSVILEIRQRAVNEEDMRNYLRYVESVLGQYSSVLARIRVLAVKASNNILAEEDRALIQVEIDQLVQEIDHNAIFGEYNKKKVMPDLTAASLGIRDVNVVENPLEAIRKADDAAVKIRKLRSLSGAESNALEFRIRGRNYYYLNLQSAESRIRDLDMAEEISLLLKNNTLLKFEFGLILKGK
jgi:flagellin